jgi:hypothetical protein
MKLSRAYVCISCKEVSDGAAHGKCPVCDSESVYPLGWLEYSQEERNRWHRLIQGRRIPSRTPIREITITQVSGSS